MQEILGFWSQLYFTELLMLFAQFIVLIAAIQRKKKETQIWLFITYAFLEITLLCVDNILLALHPNNQFEVKRFVYISNHFIVIIEIVVYYAYFKSLFNNKSFRTILNTLLILIFLILLSSVLDRIGIPSVFYPIVNHKAYAAALLFLVIPCSYYYYHLFIKYTNVPLQRRPSFWITTGAFGYSLLSIPYYILHSFLLQSEYEHVNIIGAIFYYIPITINFLFLYKGLKCKETITM